MKKWSEKQQLEKVVDLLEQGNRETKLIAIGFLSTINMANVKRELLKCLLIEDEEIALKAAASLEYMGVVPEEREAVNDCKKKWGKLVTKPANKPVAKNKNKNKKNKDGGKEIVFTVD